MLVFKKEGSFVYGETVHVLIIDHGMVSRVKHTWVSSPTPPLYHCVILGKSLNLSEPFQNKSRFSRCSVFVLFWTSWR